MVRLNGSPLLRAHLGLGPGRDGPAFAAPAGLGNLSAAPLPTGQRVP